MVVTIFVSNMDRAVKFYSEIMGLEIIFRFGEHWAQLKSADGMTIGLHPASKENPAGVKGSMQLGVSVTEPIQKVVEEMKSKGVKFIGPIRDDDQLLFANFEDPDGNPLYLAEMKHNWGNADKKSSAA
jgi:catechol 2,3-dioxygenase-like lactoylglutathione lyase family enzyme